MNIDRVWTMDPNNPWVPKASFFFTDPFGFAAQISCSGDLIRDPIRYDLQIQLVNPRGDYTAWAWWVRHLGQDWMISTYDYLFENMAFHSEAFALGFGWNRYRDALAAVGANGLPGVFALRAQIQVVGTTANLFDMTAPFGFNYQLRKRTRFTIDVTEDAFDS